MTLLIPTLATLIGIALYFAPVGKATELGRILFFVGAFWLVYLFGHSSISIR